MTSKRGQYYVRKYTWQDVNNMFCYDVKFPDRLSKKQQLLRLFKNSMKRAWDLEITGQKPDDVVSYAKACREIRRDFEKLKTAKSMKEIEDTQEKYEAFIDNTFRSTPLVGDNVSYEWRHGKGLLVYSKAELEYDPYGYYSQNFDYYPRPKEFEFREEFPATDETVASHDSMVGWEHYNEDEHYVSSQNEVKSPEELKNYVEKLREKVDGRV